MLKRIIFSTAIVLISLFLCSAGCETIASGTPSRTPPVTTPPSTVALTGIRFANENISIAKDMTYDIATVAPLIFTPSNATNKNVTYSLTSNSYAELDSTGTKIKGVANSGAQTVTLTATSADGNHTATCQVKVTDYVPLQSISFNPAMIMLKKGETVNVAPYLEFTPANASDKNVKFTVPDGSRLWLTQNDEKGSVTGRDETFWENESILMLPK